MGQILKLHNQLINKEISSLELTKEYLKNIKKKNNLNAFITILEKEALEAAKEADKLLAEEDCNILTGIPYALKDNFCTKNIRTTAGSKILEPYVPPFNATAVNKLNDAVLLGKANMDEFAMGVSGESSAFGPTKNPIDETRVPGGSSSGAACAVASNQAVFALGTDTGGSIRQPASFCGLVGLKVTYGRVSRYGVIAMASSLDTIGPITQDVEDAALVLQAIAGKDKFDSTTPDVIVPDYIKDMKKSIKGMKVGIPKEFFYVEGLDNDVKQTIEQAIEKIKKLGAKITEVSLPHTKYAIPVYYIIVPSEVSSNLARYDGIKYGFKAAGAEELLDVYEKSRAQGFGDEVKRRIMIGAYSLSAGYIDAYYRQASKVRTLIRKDFENVFKQVDCLVTPTAPTTAFKLGEKCQDPISMYLADILTAPINLAGVPALSIPAGEVKGLPVGMQIIGDQFRESDILRLGYAFENA
ncbi:MAG: Asp-tRNA(Asn)/Glu-tRNA(Gln) amidotransferase subunit GatA [Patescibacteria group bacterium]|jgi:aspartyl-tRNA(Asn)/glutamyl-tRNA(Gln) amidotransferase subunit A